MGEPKTSLSKSVQWLWINLKIGALSFGGAGKVVIYQEVIVDEKKWISIDKFLQSATISQTLPGAMVLNFVSYLGFLLSKWWINVIALALFLLPGSLLAVFIAHF